MGNISVLYMFNEGCFTFIIHYFVRIINKISPYLTKESKKNCQIGKNFNYLLEIHHFCMDFITTKHRNSVKIPKDLCNTFEVTQFEKYV